MNLIGPPDNQPLDENDLAMRPMFRETGLGEYLGAKLASGWDFSSPGRALEEQAIQAREREAYGDLSRFAGIDSQVGRDTRPPEELDRLRAESPYMAEEDWVRSPWFRQGMEYTPRMTPVRARIMAENFDERRDRDSLVQRSPGGARSVAGFVAEMAGGLPDPVNYIPFLGQAARLKLVGRAGVVAGRALASGAEGVLGNALFTPAIAADLRARGEEFTFNDYAVNVALGGFAGALFGFGHGAWARFRGETKEAVLRAIQKGVLDVGDGRAADIGSVVGPHLDLGEPLTRDAALSRLVQGGVGEERAVAFLDALDEQAARPWAAATGANPAAWWEHHVAEVRVLDNPAQADIGLPHEQARRAAQEAHADPGGEATSEVQGQGSGRTLEQEAHAARQDILAGAVDDSTQRGTLDFERFSLLSERAIEDGRLTFVQVFDLYDEIKDRISGLDDSSIRDAEEITGPLERSQWLADQIVEMERQRINAAEAKAFADELRGIDLERYDSIIGRLRQLGGISSDWVRTFHGPGVVEDLQSKLGYDIISRRGVKPDEIAGELGFTDDQGLADGQALVEYLQGAPNKKQIQEQYKDSRAGRLRFAAAMYKSPKASIGEFVQGMRENPDSKAYFPLGRVADGLADKAAAATGLDIRGAAVDLPSYIVNHVERRHPGVAWDRLAGVFQGDAEIIPGGKSRVSGGQPVIFSREEGGRVVATVAELVPGKQKRMLVTTFFEDTRKAFETWREKVLKEGADSSEPGGSPGSTQAPPAGGGDFRDMPATRNIAPDTAQGKGVVAEALGAVQGLARNALPIEIHATEADLPARLREEHARRGGTGPIKAVYDPAGGKVHFVAENISTAEIGLRLWRHEQGLHHGLRGWAGAYWSPERAEALDGFLDRVFTHFGEESFAPYREAYGFDFANPEHRRIAAEERLAQIAEILDQGGDLAPAERSLWEQFVEFVRGLFGAELPEGKLTDDGIRRVVKESVRWTFAGERGGAGPAGARFAAGTPHGAVEFAPDNRAIISLYRDADPALAVADLLPAMREHWRTMPPHPRDLRPPRPEPEDRPGPDLAREQAAGQELGAQAEPREAGEALDAPELDQVRLLREEGRLTPEDEALLAEAERAATTLDRKATAWEAALRCLQGV